MHSDKGTGLFGSHVDLDDIAKRFSESYSSQLSFGPNTIVTRIGEGFGYYSVVVLIGADWVSTFVPNDVPKRFIAKIPVCFDVIEEKKNSNGEEEIPNEDEEEKVGGEEFIAKATTHEITFYQWSKRSKQRLPIPEMFVYMNPCSATILTKCFIAMEYCPGAKSICRFDYLSLAEIEQVVRGFARLAAGYVSITAEDRDLFKPYQECLSGDEWMRGVTRKIEFFGSRNMLHQVEAILPDIIRRKHEIFEDANRGMIPVLSHADAWSTNVLMTGEGFGQRTFAKIIDFQYVHLCNPADDLIQIITCCLKFDDRKKHTKRLLRVYYDEMERLVEMMPFTWEQLQNSYYKLFAYYATKIVYLCVDDCENDSWQLQRAKEKVEGIIEEIIIYNKTFLSKNSRGS